MAKKEKTNVPAVVSDEVTFYVVRANTTWMHSQEYPMFHNGEYARKYGGGKPEKDYPMFRKGDYISNAGIKTGFCHARFYNSPQQARRTFIHSTLKEWMHMFELVAVTVKEPLEIIDVEGMVVDEPAQLTETLLLADNS
jgi:hypothetical protein